MRRVWKILRAPLAWLGPQAAKSGAAVARRTQALLFLAIGVANMAGAIVVFVFAVWVVPNPDVEDETTPIIVNLVALGIYLGVALLIGFVWGLGKLRPVRRWLREEREPTDKEKRLVLRAPVRAGLTAGVLWALAVVVFSVINVNFSGSLAIVVGITVGLGGVTTSAAAYLLTERVMRAATARALEAGPPRRPYVPGMIARSLLAFALGAGVPLLGMLLIGVYAVVDDEVSRDQLSIVILGLGGCALIVGLLLTFIAARAAADPVMSVRDAVAVGGEGRPRRGGAGVRRDRGGAAAGRLQPDGRGAAGAPANPRGLRRVRRPRGGRAHPRGGGVPGGRGGRGHAACSSTYGTSHRGPRGCRRQRWSSG